MSELVFGPTIGVVLAVKRKGKIVRFRKFLFSNYVDFDSFSEEVIFAMNEYELKGYAVEHGWIKQISVVVIKGG